jgi:hypothetical protein
MPERIHIVVDRAEKERFRRLAAREGKSLSEWIRDAARERVAATREDGTLSTAEELRAFFAACDAGEQGREPEWHVHRRVIERSIAEGAAES